MAALAAFLQVIINKIAGFAGWFLQVFLQIFVDAWEFITDGFCWVFEQLLDVVLLVLEGIADLPAFASVSEAASWFGNIPGDMMNILGLVGFGQAVGVIASALLIRFMMGLVPFVRLGG